MRVLGAMAALSCATLLTTGCIEDSDCGICDPDNLLLESISGINYAQRKVHILNPTCEGADCPADFDKGSYFIEEIGPCEETEEAKASPRGREEWCKIAPLVSAFGLEFVFNNLLDPTSIELVRKRPDNPNLFEVYDWKSKVLEIEGPISRFNGDYRKGEGSVPDQITRYVNLSCIDNLRDQGQDYSYLDLEDPFANPCNTVGASGQPLKMRLSESDGTAPKLKSYRGIWGNFGNSCDTPQEGHDDCCTRCDYLLGTQVAKYGLSQPLGGDKTIESVAAQNEEAIRGIFRTPHIIDEAQGGAIKCDAAGDPPADKYIACADFVPWVNRAEQERTYRYKFCADGNCEAADYPMPYYDQLRELHPKDRPPGLERANVSCNTTAQCANKDQLNLPGTECVGQTAEGDYCRPELTEGCENAVCRAEWFVSCRANPDTTGEQGYCVDRRFSDRGAGACYYVNANYRGCRADGVCGTVPATKKNGDPNKLAYCDGNEDSTLFGSECCQDRLQGADVIADPCSGLGEEACDATELCEFGQDGCERNYEICDPFFQNVFPVNRYERNQNLPETTRNCLCQVPLAKGDPCANVVAISCLRDGVAESKSPEEWTDADLRPDRKGQYAVKFVTRPGGVVYDPAIKGFEWRPADVGGVPRADIESCSEARRTSATGINERNVEDGWRAHDAFLAETFEEFDRALCSGQTYKVVFAEPVEGGEFVRDKVGNTLAGKLEYTFETPQFHVVPGSGFPTDNLRIGGCDEFTIRFSNKYDMSPENVAKIQLWQITDTGDFLNHDGKPCDQGECVPVAGGQFCANTIEEMDATGLPPCLRVDIENQGIGELGVQVDPAEFGPVLKTGNRYRLYVPGLQSLAEMADPVLYAGAFWDACGMPLIIGGASDFLYDFTIDPPKCKEDQDQDTVSQSCDNAPKFFNPEQGDIDRDGVGDVIDLCPTVPTSTANSADSDRDGVGNECDTCRQTVKQYNEEMAEPVDYMRVRNIPHQRDTDGDGIGDVCDNCVTVANCESYGPTNRWELGDPISFDDKNVCQSDNDRNMVGDRCQPATPDDFDPAVAAGPIGILPDDDFDQDGISNVADGCPRQPLPERIECQTDDDCPATSRCSPNFGICNHADQDGDEIGDICDSCVSIPNNLQNVDGVAQEEDDDDDFVGVQCETHSSCAFRADPRPFSFYAVSVGGSCCTTALEVDPATGDIVNSSTGLPLLDPDRVPIRLECSQAEQEADPPICRRLPSGVADRPGVINLPSGCEEALMDAFGSPDPANNVLLEPEDLDGDLNALWDTLCFLPQRDQDYDGYGDICDLCPFDFDPQNLQFIDANGKLWPKDGRFCHGDYDIEKKCEMVDPTDGETETGGTGGTAGTGDDFGTGGPGTGGGTG